MSINVDIIWWFEVTERCNLRCTFCYNDWRANQQSSHKDVDRDSLIHAALSIRNTFPNSKFILSGGDISVHRWKLDLIREISSLAPTAIVSNFEHFTLNEINSIGKSDLQEVQVSIHSHDHLKHRYLTGGGDLLKSLNNISKISEHEVRLSVVSVLNSKNKADLPGLIILCEKLGIRKLIINPVINSGSAASKFVKLEVHENSDLVNYLQQSKLMATERNVSLLLGSPFKTSKLNDMFGFQKSHPRSMKLILARGNIVKPCSSAEFSFGNLIDVLNKPDKLVAEYNQFWSAPPFLNGCACSKFL